MYINMPIFQHIQIYTKAEHTHTLLTKGIGKMQKRSLSTDFSFSVSALTLKRHCNIH